MSCKEVKKDLNGKEVFARQWAATKALEMKAKLVKVAGVDILPFVEGNADVFAMMRLESQADVVELVPLIKEFVCTVRVDGEEITPSNFDQKFRGELWEVIELFTFACEVQYKSFFEQGLQRYNELSPEQSQ